jgi:hypothetical protein
MREIGEEIKLVDEKPTCELKERWRTTGIDGQELIREFSAEMRKLR